MSEAAVDTPVSRDPGADLRERARSVRLPGRSAEYEARRRLAALLVPPGELGESADVAVWWCGVSGACPAPPPASPLAVVLVADHGIAVRGVSARPLGWTAVAAARLGAADGPLGLAAGAAQVEVQVVEVDVAGPEGPRGRPFDVGPALDVADVDRAFARGRQLAAGADGRDLLVLAGVGVGASTTAAAVVASALDLPVTSVVGRGSGIDDLAWMRKAAALRDGLRRARVAGVVAGSPAVSHLTQLGSLDTAVAVGLLVEAAVRKIPVVLDGPLAAAAALLAQRVSPTARHWWLAADGVADPSAEPVPGRVWDEISVARVLTTAGGSGLGGVAAVGAVRLAAAVLASAPESEARPDGGT